MGRCSLLSSVDIWLMALFFYLCFIALSIKVGIWPLSLYGKTFLLITQDLISHLISLHHPFISFSLWFLPFSFIYYFRYLWLIIFYCLNYTSLLFHLITSHLYHTFSCQILFSLFLTLIVCIFYCLDYTLLLLDHMYITYIQRNQGSQFLPAKCTKKYAWRSNIPGKDTCWWPVFLPNNSLRTDALHTLH